MKNSEIWNIFHNPFFRLTRSQKLKLENNLYFKKMLNKEKRNEYYRIYRIKKRMN